MKRKARRIAIILGLGASVAYFGMVGLVWWIQDSLVFAPTRGYTQLPETHGLEHEDVILEVAPGISVKGWFVRARGTPRATILYFHGSGGNLSSYMSFISQSAESGFDSFAIDYEGYGDSDGTPSEAAIYRDADAAWQWLTKTRGVDPKRVAIWGFSLGSGVATYCAERYDPGALVLQSGFTTIPDVGARIYFWLPIHRIAKTWFNNLERMPNIHVPLLIAHGREDLLIPFTMGEQLYAAANMPKKFVELNGGHNDGLDETPRLWSDVTELLQQAGVLVPL